MPVLQLVLTAAACLGLWRLCRTQPKIVIAGFLVRALLGQALFWISYLRLPFGRSLQLGNGFWFFAVDGPFYLGYATRLASKGPAAIFFDADQYPSRFFVQVLSLCVGAFGGVASIAILLNCAAFLLTCAIVVRVARPRNNVVLAAIVLSPASILFSLQPLKDTLFLLLIVAMVAAFYRWEELSRNGGRRAQFLGYAFAMCAVIFALAGIRWYIAVIACAAAAVFFVLTALQTRRRGWAFVTNALLLILLAQSIRAGGADVPPSYDRLLNPITALQWRPSSTKQHIATVRRGFETTPGATTIDAGTAIAKPNAQPEVVQVAQTETTVGEVAPVTTTTAATETVAQSEVAVPVTTTTAATETVAQSEVAPVTTTTVATETVAQREVAPVTTTTVATETVAQREVAPVTTTTVATETVAQREVAPVTTTTIVATAKPAQPPKAAPQVTPVTTTTTVAPKEPAPPPKVVPEESMPGEPAPSVPSTMTARFITGFAAMFLPRVVGESLNLIRVGGGRGLWLFAEADTLLLDLVLLYAIVYCVRSPWRRRAKLTATFVFCVLVFAMTAGSMLYTVNNFGTLFRLRLMVFCVAVVLPITLRETDATEQEH